MAAVEGDGREAPPPYFGDYPDGFYWSAVRRGTTESVESDDHTVSGQVIRFMWDYGVIVPLWSEEGLLPEEPEWLRAALGLSDELIEALSRWGHDMEALDASNGRLSTVQVGAIRDELDLRARELTGRLQRELGTRFTVEYRAH